MRLGAAGSGATRCASPAHSGLVGFEVDQIRTFGRWSSDTVLRYLGEAHVADMAKVRRLSTVQRDAVQSLSLEAPRLSGPQLCTERELERIVEAAVNSKWSAAASQLRELQAASGARYNLVLSEARRSVHALAGDLAAPSHAWRTSCGWPFASGPGFRLVSDTRGGVPASWSRCRRCFPQPAAGG